LVSLLRELDVSGPLAVLGAIIAAASTSIWMDASLAEVHTLTTAFTIATLLFAVRFGHSGHRSDLLLLTLAFSQGVAHQRAVVFLAPAVAILTLRNWRAIRRGLIPAAAISLLAPLTYLYLPWRVSQGATWSFGAPGTWQRVVTMLLDNRAERIVSWPVDLAEWGDRIMRAFAVTAADLPTVLLALGLLGLLALTSDKRWREALGLTLAWVPYILLTGAIWIGRIGDAQLAAHLPTTILAATGLAVLADLVSRRVEWSRALVIPALVGMVVLLIVLNRPVVLEVTRDRSAEAVITAAEQVAPPPAGCPTTFMALWGNDYWALAYAQAFEERLPGLDIVDHNANFSAIVARGNRLLTFSKTFYQRPVSWWQEHIGEVSLSSAAPGIVEIGHQPLGTPANIPAGPQLDLGNGVQIRSAWLSPEPERKLLLTVYWQAQTSLALDYNVAAHLVAADPPRSAEDILSQADQAHPVYGWYPTSHWHAGEVVRDHYTIVVPANAQPQAVRIAMYSTDAAGNFVNSPWLSLPIPN
jgi:hypothetical protein